MSDSLRNDAGAVTRRSFLVKAGGAGLTIASSGLLAACGGVKKSGGGGSADTLKIGFVSRAPARPPASARSTPTSSTSSARRLPTASRAATARPTRSRSSTSDSQSNPQRAAEVAKDLINSEQIDLMLATSTPEIVNPVADACEAAGVPCISTVRAVGGVVLRPRREGGRQGRLQVHLPLLVRRRELRDRLHRLVERPLKTNKKVGVIVAQRRGRQRDPGGLRPAAEEGRLQDRRPGRLQRRHSTTTRRRSRSSSRRTARSSTRSRCPRTSPPSGGRRRSRATSPIIPQIAKTGLFPSQVEALGDLGHGLIGTAFWTRTFPYQSSLAEEVEQGPRRRLRGDRQAVERRWSARRLALFDVGMAALRPRAEPEGQGGLSPTRSRRSRSTRRSATSTGARAR